MNQTKARVRRGTTVIETAIMAPLLITLMLGMVELGYAFMVRQTVTNAAREGCRAAVLSGATIADVNAAVDDTMSAASLTGYTATSNVETLEEGDEDVWVEVSIPFSRAAFTGPLWGGGSFEISSRSTMRLEGSAIEDEE